MELKLAIRSPSALVLADRELAGVKPRSIVTTYFDTRRRALRSAGFGLRLRCDDGVWSQAVKSLAGVERYEHTSKLPSSELDVALLSDTPVAALIGDGDGLIPVFTTRVERRSRTRRHAGGRAEISLDRGELIAAGRSRSILELELELKSGAPGALFERAESLCRKSDFVLDFQSKAECGFGLADATLGEPAHFERPRFAPDATAGAAFRTLARACLRQLALNEALIGDPRRPDALHQARVALRRLRVAIALFKPMLALEAVSSVRAELAWLNGELADARNLDVYLAETFGPAAGDGPVSTPAQALWSRLVEARDRAWRRAEAAVRSPRYRLLLVQTAQWIEGDGRVVESAAAAQSVRVFARAALRRRRHGLARLAGDLDWQDAQARHGLRLEAKKMRYASEFFASLAHGRSRSRYEAFVDALERLQGRLGRLNDIALGENTVLGVLPSERDHGCEFFAGVVTGRALAEVPHLTKTARRALKDFLGARTWW